MSSVTSIPGQAWLTRDSLTLAAILGVALALRIPGLLESLWFDELWSTRVKVGTFDGLIRTIATDVHPPLYLALMFGWVRLFGDSELSVRLVPLLSGLATIALTARLARTYGDRITAFVAVGILAVSPVHIWYSQEARHYSFLLLLLVASVFAFHRVRESSDWRWYAALAALSLGLAFTHFFAVAYVGVMVLVSLRDTRMRVPMVAIAAGTVAAVALYLIVRMRLWGLPTSAGSLREFELADFWRLPFEWFLTGGAFGTSATRSRTANLALLGAQLGFLALAATGLTRAGRLDGANSRASRTEPTLRIELALFVLIVPVGLATLGLLGARQYYNERSALTTLPFFAIAVGLGVATLARQRRTLAAAVVLTMVAFGAAVLASYYARQDVYTVYKPNADWRTIGRELAAEHSRTGAPVIVASMSPSLELHYYASFGLVYYSGGAAVTDVEGTAGRVYVLERPEVAQIREILARERATTLYVARNAYWVGVDPPNHVIRAADELIRALEADSSFTVQLAREAKGIRLLRVSTLGSR